MVFLTAATSVVLAATSTLASAAGGERERASKVPVARAGAPCRMVKWAAVFIMVIDAMILRYFLCTKESFYFKDASGRFPLKKSASLRFCPLAP